MKRIAIFPGSFDPFTKGHEDIVLRSVGLFDEVIIGIGKNTSKNRYFPLEAMIPKIESVFTKYPSVKVVTYEGLTAEFAKKMNARYLIRGLRNTTDFEYENTIGQANKYLWNELETVLLITSPKLAYISSSIIREIHKYGGKVNDFLPYEI
ncbi:MAG: pantetheine-phosphate adenylyltransferase [Cytophagaceae bacterium]|nr:pantetheine-phosphate adenylyltransferase [Cytophagaceae bacterium]